VLDDEEAVALAVGMQVAVRSGAVIGIEDSSVTALAKIVQVLPRRLRPQVDAVAAMTESVGWGDAPPSIDSWVLTSIAQACRDCERLTFAYVARDGSPTERSVDPHRLVLLGRRWYLVAWDLDRSDWRIFRLDRLETEHRTGRNFTPRPLPKGDAAQFVRASLDRAPTGHEIEVVVHAAASEVRNRVGRWGTVEKVDSARCLLRMTAESLDWPMMALSAIGAEFEVVSPHALIQHLRERADLFGRAAAKQ
jgi:predicted DNA-binding transcriptional regulator YafY